LDEEHSTAATPIPSANIPEEHKKEAPDTINIGIITVSDSRDIADDISGNIIKDLAKEHRIVAHVVVKDKKALIKNELMDLILNNLNPVNVIIMNGGTGLSKSDVTIDAISPMFTKKITAFEPLFASLSFGQVKSAAMLSRAAAGIMRGRVVFCLPGSPDACRLAMEKLIMPELGHILKHIDD